MARGSVALIVSDSIARSADHRERPVVSGEAPLGRPVVGNHGERTAISIELADPECVAGLVVRGSWVAVFVSEDPEPYLADSSARKLPPLTRILLPKVQVLGVGEPADSDTETTEQALRTILTIAVTQAEAEKVIDSSRNGDLTFALRSERSQVANRPATTGREIAPELYDSAS